MAPEYIKLIRLVHELGADVTQQDGDGNTAVHHLAYSRFLEMSDSIARTTLETMAYVLVRGASVCLEVENDYGDIPVDILLGAIVHAHGRTFISRMLQLFLSYHSALKLDTLQRICIATEETRPDSSENLEL
ncbi:hypothetical protein V8F06_011895 [Rhypophila decipiens]